MRAKDRNRVSLSGSNIRLEYTLKKVGIATMAHSQAASMMPSQYLLNFVSIEFSQ
jgi:hypothetical protein